MSSKDKYSSIPELVKVLNTGTGKLDKGELHIDDLESLCETAREVYERLVVLKYKAYTEEIKPEQPKVVPEEESKSRPAFKIKTDENQINLIDAIEEHHVDEVAEQEDNDDPASLNDQLFEEKESLAEKLQKTSISSLKKAIGLNQKFRFVTELFEGDNGAYENMIKDLEKAETGKSAIEQLNKIMKERKWEESPVLDDLKDLVERRHL